MLPRLRWTDLPGRRVGVWGLGVEGRAALRKLATLGIQPVLVDDRPLEPAVDGVDVLRTEDGGWDALNSCDVVLAGPGISRYRSEVLTLTERGVAVVGGLALWLEEAAGDRVVCVTGTKGKSTTVAIAGALLEGLGYRVFTGGNIGRPPFDPDTPGDFDFWVIEVSSFQAVSLTCAPRIVAVTSMHPDHLDWHGDVETYYRDKLSLCRRPGSRLTVASAEDALLPRYAKLLGPEVRWVRREGDVPQWIEAMGLIGRHNQVNALIARECVEALGAEGAGDPAVLAKAVSGFRPLESRLRPVGRLHGVELVDDSLSTNVLSTLAALSAFPDRRVAVLVGGLDRGIDYSELAEYLRTCAEPRLVLTIPDSGGRIAHVLRNGNLPAHVEVGGPAPFEESVARAVEWARPDGVVLLSPAAPSFGRFRDYRERAERFLTVARELGPVETAG